MDKLTNMKSSNLDKNPSFETGKLKSLNLESLKLMKDMKDSALSNSKNVGNIEGTISPATINKSFKDYYLDFKDATIDGLQKLGNSKIGKGAIVAGKVAGKVGVTAMKHPLKAGFGTLAVYSVIFGGASGAMLNEGKDRVSLDSINPISQAMIANEVKEADTLLAANPNAVGSLSGNNVDKVESKKIKTGFAIKKSGDKYIIETYKAQSDDKREKIAKQFNTSIDNVSYRSVSEFDTFKSFISNNSKESPEMKAKIKDFLENNTPEIGTTSNFQSNFKFTLDDATKSKYSDVIETLEKYEGFEVK